MSSDVIVNVLLLGRLGNQVEHFLVSQHFNMRLLTIHLGKFNSIHNVNIN